MINFDTEYADQMGFLETDYLKKAVLGVQTTLRKLFFANGVGQEPKYLACLIEELWAGSECTLNTFFRVSDLDEVEDDAPLTIELRDSLPEPA